MSGADLVRVGLIGRVRGVKGELFVKPLTGNPKRLSELGDVHIEKADGTVRPDKIEYVKLHSGQTVIKLLGCNDADAAGLYKGGYVSITADLLAPLGKDSYYIFDLIGCDVLDASGTTLGKVIDVLETGGNDVYVVRPIVGDNGGRLRKADGTDKTAGTDANAVQHKNEDGIMRPRRTGKTGKPADSGAYADGDLLVPAIKSCVLEVSIDEKRMVVDAGMIICDSTY